MNKDGHFRPRYISKCLTRFHGDRSVHLTQDHYIVDADDLGYNGNHYFAIFKGPEKYEVLQTALSDLVSETTRLKSIDVDGVTYKIVFYLGGDLKFRNVVSGLDSCCCTYSCVFCKCPKQECYDVTKTWSVSDQVYGARTIEENEAYSKLKKKKQAYNCAHAPLFKIPVAKTVPDVLHLFLRICDQLVAQLITELRDNIEKAVWAIDRGKCSNIVKFKEFGNITVFIQD